MRKNVLSFISVLVVITAMLAMTAISPVRADTDTPEVPGTTETGGEEQVPEVTEPVGGETAPAEPPAEPPLEEELPIPDEAGQPEEVPGDLTPPVEAPIPEEAPALEEPMLMMSFFAAPTVENRGQNGTTLSADKTAAGHWVRTWSWSISKSVDPTYFLLYSGDSGTSTYTVSVVKEGYTDKIWVDGRICVTNGGEVTTENLTLVDQVQYKKGSGQFQPLDGASQTITPAELGPSETGCYEYSISFTPIDGAIYRNTVKVTITNHSGHLGEPYGPEPKADFSLPASPTEVNASIHVDDTNGGTWIFNDSGSVKYDKTFYCSDAGKHTNTATIRETGQYATATVEVECIQVNGCTLTIGYWKNHAGFGPQPDVVSELLPVTLGTGSGKSVFVTSAAYAVKILSFGLGDPSNGITKLYAQLLAAKLNIANGADGSAVATTIANADAFLAGKDYLAWASLNKNDRAKVLTWMTTLDNYNNGLIGPGHCTK